MYRKIDLSFCGLMLLGALGHTFGTLKYYTPGSDLFVWSLSGALAAFLLVAINLVRRRHPYDRTVALFSAVGCIAWLVVVGMFAHVIHSYFDPRVLIHALATLGLLVFSVADMRTEKL